MGPQMGHSPELGVGFRPPDTVEPIGDSRRIAVPTQVDPNPILEGDKPLRGARPWLPELHDLAAVRQLSHGLLVRLNCSVDRLTDDRKFNSLETFSIGAICLTDDFPVLLRGTDGRTHAAVRVRQRLTRITLGMK